MGTPGTDQAMASSRWSRLRARIPLAYRVFLVHPTMPATAFWRIYEAEVVMRRLVDRVPVGAAERGLDLGCGDGRFTSLLLGSAPALRWFGLEKDASDAELARRSGIYEEVRVAPGEEMPFDPESFDLVFSNCVLEHVEGLDAAIAQVGRVLKPRGRFLFTVPTETFHDELWIPRVLRGLGLPGAAARYVAHLDERLELRNLLDREEWRAKLEKNGLRICREIPYATRRAASCWEVVATLTGGMVYMIARRRAPLRRIQHSAGLVGRERRWLGALFFVLLLPLILLTAVQRDVPPHAGRYVEAVKKGETG